MNRYAANNPEFFDPVSEKYGFGLAEFSVKPRMGPPHCIDCGNDDDYGLIPDQREGGFVLICRDQAGCDKRICAIDRSLAGDDQC